MSNQNFSPDEERIRILETLIRGEKSAPDLQILLGRFESDSKPLVTLEVSHIGDMLRRFMSDQISRDDVEQWADLIEVRDDIAFDPTRESEIRQAIHELANPVLFGSLDIEMAGTLLRSLQPEQAEQGKAR